MGGRQVDRSSQEYLFGGRGTAASRTGAALRHSRGLTPEGGPDRDCQRIARQMARRRRVEAGGAAPLGDLVIGEAEPSVRLLLAQKFERVRREIDDDQN